MQGEGGSRWGRTYVFQWLIRVVWQKSTHCKATNFQFLKKNYLKEIAELTKLGSLMCILRGMSGWLRLLSDRTASDSRAGMDTHWTPWSETASCRKQTSSFLKKIIIVCARVFWKKKSVECCAYGSVNGNLGELGFREGGLWKRDSQFSFYTSILF